MKSSSSELKASGSSSSSLQDMKEPGLRPLEVGRTYRTKAGQLFYIQDLCGQKVTYNVVGSVFRRAGSLRRLQTLFTEQVPNQ